MNPIFVQICVIRINFRQRTFEKDHHLGSVAIVCDRRMQISSGRARIEESCSFSAAMRRGQPFCRHVHLYDIRIASFSPKLRITACIYWPLFVWHSFAPVQSYQLTFCRLVVTSVPKYTNNMANVRSVKFHFHTSLLVIAESLPILAKARRTQRMSTVCIYGSAGDRFFFFRVRCHRH